MKEYKYNVNGVEYKVNINSVEGDIAQVDVNGVSYEVKMDKVVAPKPVAVPKPVAAAPVAKPAAAETKPAPEPVASASGKALKAPLPCVVNDIKVAVGDAVKVGQTVLILEAMKMENEIAAEVDGTVTSIFVGKGDSVMEGSVLLTIG